ncbi:MAG: hypothetical protein CL543_07695 [Alcanivorax sp.]|nr:hypothetical protein [Alcanivorax sp.]
MKRQRGALTFITPMIMVTIILLGALAMDGARLYSLKREMQSIANTAATIAVNDMQTCSGNSIYGGADWSGDSAIQDAVGEDVERLGGDLTITPGLVESDGDKILGFRPADNYNRTNAARVDYEIPDTPISALFPAALGALDLKATAVAKKEVIATISAAGSTAIVGGGADNAGLLGALLGGLFKVEDYTLDATSVESLAETTFELGGLLDDLGVSDGLTAVDDLVGADEILQGILAGLDGAEGAAETIQRILESSTIIDTNIRLDEVLALISDVQYPQSTPVPVYDTVVALALNVASGVTDITREVDIGLGELLNVELSLLVNEPPSVAVGPARVGSDGEPETAFKAADISIALKVDVAVPPLLDLTIPIMVKTGGGTGYLDSARCASGSNNDVTFGVTAQANVAEVSTSELYEDGSSEVASISAELLPDLAAVLASLNISATIEELRVGSATEELLPPMTYDLYNQVRQTETISSGGEVVLTREKFNVFDIAFVTEDKSCSRWDVSCVIGDALGGVWDTLNDLLGEVTGALEDVLADVVLQVVGDVLDSLVVPLLESLGIHLGGMSVSVVSADQGAVILLDCSAGECDIIQ